MPPTPPTPASTSPAPIPAPLAPFVDALGPARAGAREKGVHRLRVATRRLDTWLRLAGLRVLRDDLRWIRGVASPVRDLDVLLALPWPDPVRARLKAERRAARAVLVAALDAPRLVALVEAVELLPPLAPEAAARRARHLVRALVALPVDPAVPADVHQRRRALRRVRYAHELLGAPVDALVGLQDALGVVSDLWVRRQHVPDSIRDADLAAALAAAETAWAAALPKLESLK